MEGLSKIQVKRVQKLSKAMIRMCNSKISKRLLFFIIKNVNLINLFLVKLNHQP